MSKITCIIIDDERIARETFKGICERYLSERFEVIGMADSVKEGVELIKQHHPPIIEIFTSTQKQQLVQVPIIDYTFSF